MSNVTPLRAAVLTSTSLALAFAIIAGAVQDNTLRKLNKQKDFIKAHASMGTVVDVNHNDVFQTTIVLIVSCSLISSFASNPLILYLFPKYLKAYITRSFIRFQTFGLAFCSLWTIATVIPFDVFFAMRQVKITVTSDGVAVPQQMVDMLIAQLGVDPVYKNQSYLRLVAIFPWIAVFFGLISVIILFIATDRMEPASPAMEDVVEKAPVKNVDKDADAVPEVMSEMNLKSGQGMGDGLVKDMGNVSAVEVV